ncbi:MAG: hypothetical protein EOO52_19430 [Gammaproteobacteria bacterium]|nr:MAG: hypothetical protein EOO52_19430 [Gammaproteobacteria bacterium]
MRKIFRVLAVSMIFVISGWAHAHEGHTHLPVTMKKAVEIALETARTASEEAQPALGLQRLDDSWRALPVEAARIHENVRGHYVVSVKNAAQNKTLYVRILLDGQVNAANFSGKFDDEKPAPKSIHLTH